jgi:hypothetical protein
VNRKAKRKYSNNILSHVADDTVCFSGTTVIGRLSIPENLQGAENLINGKATP